MNLLDVFYYCYFLYYKKLLRDPDPHFFTLASLSFSESLIFVGIMNFIAVKFYCYILQTWIQFSVYLLILFLNYRFYWKNDRNEQIIEDKPSIGNSPALSKLITFLFTLITISWLFWGPILGKHLLSLCR